MDILKRFLEDERSYLEGVCYEGFTASPIATCWYFSPGLANIARVPIKVKQRRSKDQTQVQSQEHKTMAISARTPTFTSLSKGD